jgi:CBS domain-containing protein
MTRDVITCFVNTPLQEIARIMREQDIGALPVINQEGVLEGIVTDRDLVVKGLTSKADDTSLKAQDCMSTDLYVAQKNDRVVDVIREMGDHQIRRVPVVDSRNRLVGIVAVADLATQTSRDRELGDAFEEISRPKSWFDRVTRWLGF